MRMGSEILKDLDRYVDCDHFYRDHHAHHDPDPHTGKESEGRDCSPSAGVADPCHVLRHLGAAR